MSKPITPVRADPEKIQILMSIFNETKKATAINKAIDHVLGCDVLVLPELTVHGHFLTVKQTVAAMKAIGIHPSESTIRRWCKSGKLEAMKPPGEKSHWRIKVSSVDNFITMGYVRPIVKRY